MTEKTKTKPKPSTGRRNNTTTCNQLKNQATKKLTINNYSIKRKHLDNAGCFFASKHFELSTPYEKIGVTEQSEPTKNRSSNFSGKASEKSKDKKDRGAKSPSKTSKGKKSEDGDIDRKALLIVTENIEEDKKDLARQNLSSWA